MGQLFDDLSKGLKEAKAHATGKKRLRSKKVAVNPPPEYEARDVKRIRKKSGYSQLTFSLVLNVSIKTIQAWESGYRSPSQIALRMLQVVDNGYYQPRI